MSERDVANAPGDRRGTIEWLFDTSGELLLAVAADGRIERASRGWAAGAGWSPAELVGRRLDEIVRSDDAGGTLRLRAKCGSWRPIQAESRQEEDGCLTMLLRTETPSPFPAEIERKESVNLAKAAGVGAWSYEPLTDVVAWSPELAAVLGYSQTEIRTNADFTALVHPDDLEAARHAFRAAIAEGVGRSFEIRLRAKDGGWRNCRTTLRTESRPGGVFALNGISQDITELTAARDAATRGERQIRRLVEGAPFAVAMFDRELRYVVVSPRWLDTFGLGERPHIGLPLQEVFPSIPKRLLSAARRALQGEHVAAPEDRFTDGRGQTHWLRWEARPWRDAAGRVGGILAYVNDVSGLSKARREAQSNARRLKIALQAADAGVYEIDHVAKTFWISPELKKLIGPAGDYESARRLRTPAFHPEDREMARAAFLANARGRRSPAEGFEARIMTPSGEPRWVRIFHELKVSRTGRWLRGVGLVQDIDDQKRQELALIEAQRAAQAGAEAKSAFLANMSHEIRTPLNGVMGVLHLLKSEQLSEEGRRMLEEALSCGHMLSELLNDVIDFSKIEAGRLELSLEPVHPAEVLGGVTRLLRPQAEAKGLGLDVELPSDLGWILTDPVRLRQALFNLVGNAVKFTVHGRVAVRAAPVMRENGPRLRFEIEDTGVGIPAAVQPRIFQRFDQGLASTTRRFGGSGLGLAITQKLAEMLGGAVGFVSEEGRGSTFWLEVAAEPAQAAQACAPEADSAYLNGLRILVVEDNPTNRMIATKLLENLGAAVETAADGLLGVEAAAQGGFDLVLMDVQMPGIDGPEAARRIRRLPGPAGSVPIIALTANVLAHQHQAYLAAGMNGVVGKPIVPAALLGEIARLSRPENAAA